MQVSNNYNRYDTIVNENVKKETVKSTNKIKNFLAAFRVDLSQRALNSSELRDPNINFPTYNTNVLQYEENLNLILKP